jgi:hypothetical protein
MVNFIQMWSDVCCRRCGEYALNHVGGQFELSARMMLKKRKALLHVVLGASGGIKGIFEQFLYTNQLFK